MSHYSVCVILPEKAIAKYNGIGGALDKALEPFEECPSNREYLAFCDKQEEVEKEYLEGCCKAIQYPDGKILPIYAGEFYKNFFEDKGVIYDRKASKEKNTESEESKKLKLIPEYRNKDAYESLEKFCKEYHDFKKNQNGRWGYYCNPNAKWDWYEIGGRFANEILVNKNASETIAHNIAANCVQNALYEAFPMLKREGCKEVDGGFYLVDFARKDEIAWEKIREDRAAKTKDSYETYCRWLENGKVEPEKSLLRVTEEGVVSWNGLVLKRGESYEEFCKRIGFDPKAEYSLSPYSILDRNGVWHSLGEMGWWGISLQEQNACDWDNEIQRVLRETEDSDVLVYVDCHI